MKFNRSKISLAGLALSLLGFSACSDYLDINNDPTAISDSQVTMAALMPTVLEATAQANYQHAFSICQVAQHINGVSGGGVSSQAEFRIASGWSFNYLSAMTNTNALIKRAQELNAPHYAGLGKILMAYNLQMASDAWENIPYSQAFSLSNLKPAYDSQESIYGTINRLLDEAIVDLGQTTSGFSPGTDDLIFRGDRNRWRRTAQALKARIAMHLSLKSGGATAATNALAALTGGGMISNADDCQLVFNTRNLNPWHSGVALANNTGNVSVRHSAQLADAMNGTTFGIWDPRLPLIAGRLTANANARTWLGNEPGTGLGGNIDLVATSWHSRNLSPIQFVTFAEQKFIQAEAEFLKNNGTTTSKGTTAAGYTAYLDGVRASLDKIGVADTARTRYLGSPIVAPGASNLTLGHIMVEKWKAMFLNPEVWADMRRWEYSADVYKDLQLPAGLNPELGGKWTQRAQYPDAEFTRNGPNATKNVKPLAEPMWVFKK
jgi:Starch-binding associating with outer membrane